MENPTEIISIREKIKTINNTTENGVDDVFKPANYGNVALNVYQIYPKKIIYPLRSQARVSPTGTTDQFLLSRDLIDVSYNFQWNRIGSESVTGPFNIGINYPRSFYIYNSSAGATDTSVNIEYIDSSGDLAITQVRINTNTTAVRLQNAININRISWSNVSGNSNLYNPNVIYAQDTIMQVIRANQWASAVITVPNSYVGVLTDVYINTELSLADIQMIVKDKWNNVKSIRHMPNVSYIAGRSAYYGSVNYPLDPGDSVFFSCVYQVTQFLCVDAIVTLTAI